MIDYQIRIKSAEAHIFEIRCNCPAPDAEGQRFSLPVWTPGSYLIREFAKHVLSVRAECMGRQIATEKIDKHTWRCASAEGALTFVYEIYAFDLSVRGAYLDTTRAFFNGAGVLVWPHGLEYEPCTLTIAKPALAVSRGWRVATSMQRSDIDANGFGLYLAADYDELIDHPVEISKYESCAFEAGQVEHSVAVSGRQSADLARLARDVSMICEQHIRLFGEVPFSNYLFQLHVVGDGYGGLEHRASTSLIASRKTLPRIGSSEQSADYRSLLRLFSHEYFHAWNVKRIKPLVFTPYDLTRESYTQDLWLYEGVTSYYDDLALVRSGVIDQKAYLELLGQTITRVLRGSGRLNQSVAESSFDAWIKFYRPDENAPNALVSYYAKGSLIALALDLFMRRESTGRHSLDDAMRVLWTRYGKTGVGVPEGAMQSIIAETGGEAAAAFLRQAVYGINDLPLENLLRAMGIEYHLRAADSAEDKGGSAGTKQSGNSSFGVRAEGKNDPILKHVFSDGAAQRAGLAPGDQLIAIDGLRITAGLDAVLQALAPHRHVKVHAFRRDELMEFDVTLLEAERDTCFLQAQDDADATALSLRNAWLGGPDDAARAS